MILFSKKYTNLLAVCISILIIGMIIFSIFYFQQKSSISNAKVEIPTQPIYTTSIQAVEGSLRKTFMEIRNSDY